MMVRHAFTLVEVMATLLLLAVGVTAILGMVRYGTRLNSDAQMRTTSLMVVETVALDPTPGDLTADPGDVDDDGWKLVDGVVAAPATGPYAFIVQGHVDGYYVRRSESSTDADILDPTQRWAHITVDIYAGDEDRYLTTVRQRLLRRTWGP